METRFTWDTSKAESNLEKHGISFETATKAFDDANYVLIRDRVDAKGEQRWHAIGAVATVVLLVVHVYRKEAHNEEIIRIISARKASQRERRIYLQQAIE